MKWLKPVHQNTQFFHSTMNKKISQLIIKNINNPNIGTVVDAENIGKTFVEYYSSLVSTEDVSNEINLVYCIKRSITTPTNDKPAAIPDVKEIWDTFCAINEDSAPRPDGFGSTFYLKFWEIIKLDLVLAV